jgi:hypothetical protein
MWHSVRNNCECLLLRVGEYCNKGINNLTGVFSGVTRKTGDQNWSSTPNIVQYVIFLNYGISCVMTM